VVTLSQSEGALHREATADTGGHFDFQNIKPANYSLQAEWHGQRSLAVQVEASTDSAANAVTLVIAAAPNTPHGASNSDKEAAMEFADEPSFTIAGVTDWTAVGGHGSDANLRTSETLARQTSLMQDLNTQHRLPGLPAENSEAGASETELRQAVAKEPQSFRANHALGDFLLRGGQVPESITALQTADRINPADRNNAYELALAYKMAGDIVHARAQTERLLQSAPDGNVHRIMGEIDEAQGDPLNAVREFEAAVRVDASEENYFAWGSELLLHRAIWQAKTVFEKGAAAYPKSSRMITGLGASLFAGALYEQAAQRLCEASDLDPADPKPYEILGNVDAVAPDPLPCIETRLARFAELQPSNSEADYLYAAAILRRHTAEADDPSTQQAERLLTQAVATDPHCGEAYLQLGILSSSRRDTHTAVSFFQKAVAAKPELGDAHYRLAVAYDRLGEKDKAQQEFTLHEKIEKEQAAAVEKQRHEIKQFEVASQREKN
jgi:tetratricopeptide (TPR) repeat protein